MMDTNIGYRLTRHAERRCAQRGYRAKDLELILEYGTRTAEGVLLRHRDIRAHVEELRRQIRVMEKRQRTHNQ